MPLIHVVIPFLDEESTLERVVERLQQCTWPDGWKARPILVDDGSDAAAAEAARSLAGRDDIELLRHDRNRGKGAALRTAFARIVEEAADEDVVGIQDADLEYDPRDLARIVGFLDESKGSIDAVFGNRFDAAQRTAVRKIHRFGNRLLTRLSNLATGLRVSDMECCYKVVRIPTLRSILPDLDEDRFAIEPQLAATLARHGAIIAELPISYDPRSFSEGKKIGLADAFAAVATIVREWWRTHARARAR